MAKRTQPNSLSSRTSVKSHVSRRAAKVTETLKAGVKTVARPLKRLRKSISSSNLSCATSRALARSSEPDTVDAIELPSDSRSIEIIGGSAMMPAPSDARSIHSAGSHGSQSALDEESDEQELAHLQATWRSPVYAFFKSNVSVQYKNGHKCHFFTCATRKCRNVLGGVRRYQDSKDKASTSNLKSHIIHCFGAAAVEAAIKGENAPRNDSIFAVFARQGQQPVTVSHRTHSNPEVRAHLVKWITECNRPAHLISDREFQELMTAGHPGLLLPTPMTLQRDVKASFQRCRERIGTLLREHPGHLNFATDAWTSPNHCAFVA
ncbi:hypothetical protein SCP_1102720 [Sparassis crispa]|uniref:Uncharacterized protein n=1 Tax=Sparassis crispa TaxID=139825 RepID=A0A401GZJ2_9APHY|nr:hypothetical protein SCP_1102720 [Sparassis crispa]GBE87595.1 hypothetical protein SCP_1102720 [Sparassis crispa]